MRRGSVLRSGLILLAAAAVLVAPAPARADADALREIGNWPFGQSLAVEEDPGRDIAYVGSGGAVLIVDIGVIANPQLISDTILSEGLVVDLAYDTARQLLFLAAGNKGLEVWDVRDPTSPERLYAESVANYGSIFPAEDVVVSGNFVVVNNGSLRVYDVTDPAHPERVDDDQGSRTYTNDIYLDENGKLNAAQDDGYLRFTILPSGYLLIESAYEPPVGGFSLVAASVSPNIAYLYKGSQLQIVDPEDPYFPLLSSFGAGANVNDVDYQDGYLYFVKGANRELHIYDVSDPYSPFPVSVTALPTGGYRLEVVGDHVYVAGGYSGLVIIDVSDPYVPEIEGQYDTLGRNASVELLGDYAYLAENDDGVLIIDVSDPASPALVNQYDTPGWVYDVFIHEGLLYIADGEEGLRICDLVDPVNPSLLSVGDVTDAGLVIVSEGYAYVVDQVVNGDDTIRVLDVSDPGSPNEVGSRLMSDFVLSMDIIGDYLYAACYDYGLRVLDVSGHGNPVEASFYPLNQCSDVEIQGGYAYAIRSEWDGGLYTFDITDPAHPSYVSNYHLPLGSSFYGLTVEGLFAYVTVPVSDYVLELFLGDPEHPTQIDEQETPGEMRDLIARDGLVYVADGSAGLRVLQNNLFYNPGANVAWEVQDSGVTAHLRGVHFADALHGCAAGNYGTVVTTDNGGDTWTSRSSGTSEDLFAVYFASPTIGWIGGRYGVLRKTTDGGAHWAPQSTPGTHWLMSVDFVDELHGWVSGSEGVVLRTIDGGANWVSGALPVTTDVNGVSFADEQTGWACTSTASVYKTTNGGSDWDLQTSESGEYSSFQSIAFVDSLTGWVVGGLGLGGQTYGTTDGGFSWKEIQGSHDYFLQSVCFVDQQHGWAVGHDGTILASVPDYTGVPEGADVPGVADNPADGHDAAALAAGLVLHAGSPNPFTPSTMIAYELPVEGDVELRIYDVSGHVVRTLVDARQAAGSKSVVWDGRSDEGRTLASGVYLSKLVVGEEVRREKLVLVR